MLADQNGKVRAGLAEDTDGSVSLRLFDKDGNVAAALPGGSQQSAHSWVLWKQGFLFVSGRLQKMIVAVGAWPTQGECEAQKEKQKKPEPNVPGGVLHTCLPDTVRLPEER
jgi:hypothetical protein